MLLGGDGTWVLCRLFRARLTFPLRHSNAAISFDGVDSTSKNFSTFVRMTRPSNFFSLDLPDRVKNECRRLQANRERRVRYPKKEISITCKIGQKRVKSRLITTNAKFSTLVRRRTKYFEIRVHSHKTPLGNLWKVNGHNLHCIAPPFKTT